MDEPTSALSDKEVQVLYQIIRRLTSENRSILFISHKLEEVFELVKQYLQWRETGDTRGWWTRSEVDGRPFKHSLRRTQLTWYLHVHFTL